MRSHKRREVGSKLASLLAERAHTSRAALAFVFAHPAPASGTEHRCPGAQNGAALFYCLRRHLEAARAVSCCGPDGRLGG